MYLLADTLAIYTLGHMSISCKPDEHHKLMAFWAPFFLVHLGGQDTITAYSMEDNQLWLRHALTFLVQAVGTVYVFYKNIGRQWALVMAAVMMFLAGVLKIFERVWALSSSSLDSISNYLGNVEIRQKDEPYSARGERQLDAGMVLQVAHDLLYICMGQFVDDKVCPSKFQMDCIKLFLEKNGSTYELIGMQLSLMYDIFYNKAAAIHTWWGRCFRAVSLLSTATSFLLFHFSTVTDGYNRVDVVITYILLVGASLLEMASVLKAMGIISADTKVFVRGEIKRTVQACEGRENLMRSYRGQCVLQRYELLEDLTWSTEMEFDDSILAWHLATHEFLKHSNGLNANLVNATKALSDYMMFLFVERPYMLPPPVRPSLYDKAMEELKKSKNWLEIGPQDRNGSAVPACTHGANLATQLLNKRRNMPELLQVVFGVWVEMLCYAAHHCSRDSHARQLNCGGDFITIVWLLTAAEFNNAYYHEGWFKERVHGWRCSLPLSWRYRCRSIWGCLLFPCVCLLVSCFCCIFRDFRDSFRPEFLCFGLHPNRSSERPDPSGSRGNM
ncbi:uncharacterized protein [Setaria viridis]|uniref:uncharacterized protein n=1 Tax=Setaria viridis TaxID=4556 RepID=UPI003B3AF3ED